MAVTDAAHGQAAHARRGVYGISVMSELSGVGPQTLRLYERRGLLTPARTGGGDPPLQRSGPGHVGAYQRVDR